MRFPQIKHTNKRKAYRRTQLVMSTLTAPAYQRQQQQQQEELLQPPEIGAVKQEPTNEELEQRLSPNLSAQEQPQRCDSASSGISQQQAYEEEQTVAGKREQANNQWLANRLRATTTHLATNAATKMTNKAEQQQQQQQLISSNNQNKQTGKLMDAQQMHVCRLCDKLLSSSSSLDRHMLTHSGERPFVCKRCHMTFTTNGNMHRHMRTHLHKDSLARQQLEQQQLKSLSASVAPISSSASPIAGQNGQMAAQSGASNIFNQQQHQQAKLLQHSSYNHNHNNSTNHQNQNQEIAASSSPLLANHHQHHQASSVTALLNQQLVEAFKHAPAAISARGSRRQPEVSAALTSGAVNSSSISSPHSLALSAAQSPMGIETQNQAKFLHQQPIDTKTLMIGALQGDQLGLESVKAVMLAAAAAAAAAAVSQQQQPLFPLEQQPDAQEDELSSSGSSKQQPQSQLQHEGQLVGRGKRRKQVNPRCSTRSTLLSLRQAPSSPSGLEQEMDSDCEGQGDAYSAISPSSTRRLLGEDDEGRQKVSALRSIRKFDQEDSSQTIDEDAQQEEEAAMVKREDNEEDFNNNNNRAAQGEPISSVKGQQLPAASNDAADEDGDEQANLSVMSMMGSDEEVSNSASTMSGLGGDTIANMNSNSSMIGEDEDEDDVGEDEDDVEGNNNNEDDDDNVDCKPELLSLPQQHPGGNSISQQLGGSNTNSNSNPNSDINSNNQSNQLQRQQAEPQQTLPSPLTTVNGEIIEDISQSYVKTANPNAARKGGKRNRHCYKCKLCTYSSVDRCTLVRHLRIHSGERPYICGICRYAFTTKANCERHVRKRHKKQYNSLGGAGGGGVKGSNGGGRSLIITDHSNHQTIPVKVNPVAAQTISQTLQKIQEKQQQQQNSTSEFEDRGDFGIVGGTQTMPTTTTIPASTTSSNIIAERISNHHYQHNQHHNSHLNQLDARTGLNETSGGFSKAIKRKYRANEEQALLGEQALPYQRRRLMELGSGRAAKGAFEPATARLGGGSKRSHLSDSNLSNGTTTGTTLLFERNQHLNQANNSFAPETPLPSTNELFVNLMQQLQQVTTNVNNTNQQPVVNASSSLEHPQTQSANSSGISAGSPACLTSATFLANMLAAGKSLSSASGDSNQQAAAAAAAAAALQGSLLSPKNLSQQFAQLRNLTQSQTPFFIRRNPFDPFNPIDLAAQALDLSCKFQLSK